MNDRTVKGVTFAGVTVIHVVAYLVVTNLRAQKKEAHDPFVNTLFLIDASEKRSPRPLPVTRRATDKKLAVRREGDAARMNSQPSSAPITLPSIDWNAERAQAVDGAVARERARRDGEPLNSKPKVIERAATDSRRKRGDTQHLGNGEIITWIDERCYATNLPAPGPQMDPNARGLCASGDRQSRMAIYSIT
ncbi:MAG TPA: hypothetical protein VK629_19110 [Steroidobacteraceae bacterium]|nr:hypothetical protein [Steroidobacteraceae bacterium]